MARTVGGTSKEIFVTLPCVLRNVRHLGKISLWFHHPLRLYVREGEEKVCHPTVSRWKQVMANGYLIPLQTLKISIPTITKNVHSKCKREKCFQHMLWANRLCAGILRRNSGKLRPELLKEDGPSTATSSGYSCRSTNVNFWKWQILVSYNWMKTLDLFTSHKYTNTHIFLSCIFAKEILKT